MRKPIMHKLLFALSSSIVFSGAVVVTKALAAPMTFQSAVAEYRAGKYSSALAMFKAFAQSSPNNVQVHYYLAMCHHRMGHVEQARQEYNFVIAKGEPSFKALAEKGLTSIAGASASSGAVASSSGSTTGSSSSTPVPASQRAAKVMDFTATWCGPCKQFAPVFEEVKRNSKFRGIQFQSVDLDENHALADQYNVKSIPTVVIISSSGAVLYNDHPPRDVAGFEEVVSRFH